ncbi:MAG: Hpt domain-containing protein [Fuerstiella sp.]|jgi:HPt (histidine-containing phosphotransfer) domain-containing protein|nr:Hpt domain-containing protein [Fuerstiella sp.]
MTHDTLQSEAIYSSLATDPDLCELAEMYVDEMPDKIVALETAFSSGDMEALRQKAHQLKGAAGSYGFDQLTPYAAALEASIRNQQPPDHICDALNQVITLCRRVRSGQPQ